MPKCKICGNKLGDISVCHCGEPIKLFVDSGDPAQSVNIGWQPDVYRCLIGMIKGYRESADIMIEYVQGLSNPTAKIDSFIYPILFSYRHCVELFLKLIYLRHNKTAPGGHSLTNLYKKVNNTAIASLIVSNAWDSQDAVQWDNLKRLTTEMQSAGCTKEESASRKNTDANQTDVKADVWRYMFKDMILYFTHSHTFDYVLFAECFDRIFNKLEDVLRKVEETDSQNALNALLNLHDPYHNINI